MFEYCSATRYKFSFFHCLIIIVFNPICFFSDAAREPLPTFEKCTYLYALKVFQKPIESSSHLSKAKLKSCERIPAYLSVVTVKWVPNVVFAYCRICLWLTLPLFKVCMYRYRKQYSVLVHTVNKGKVSQDLSLYHVPTLPWTKISLLAKKLI